MKKSTANDLITNFYEQNQEQFAVSTPEDAAMAGVKICTEYITPIQNAILSEAYSSQEGSPLYGLNQLLQSNGTRKQSGDNATIYLIFEQLGKQYLSSEESAEFSALMRTKFSKIINNPGTE